MTTLFISDLHLSPTHPALTAIFLTFLKKQAGKVDALYILGDLFEAWVGDDDDTSFAQTLRKALHTFAQQGTPLYIMPGNRDFLIGHTFCQQTGATLLPDPYLIDLYGERVLLLHGDSLCTQDKKHLFFRKITHLSFLQKIALGLPLRYRMRLANKLRYLSQAHTRKLNSVILDATEKEIARLFNHYKINLMIHGHTHRPGITLTYLPHRLQQRFVLRDWETHAHALVCDKTGHKQLMTL